MLSKCKVPVRIPLKHQSENEKRHYYLIVIEIIVRGPWYADMRM